MSDGLDMLDERRARTRRIPASKNPPRSKPVAVPSAITQPPKPEEAEPQLARQENKPEPQLALQEPEPLKSPTAKPAAPEPTVKMSIYLEPSDDLYLEEIAHAGKTSRPRVALSRSAIVRLALERLGDTTTVDEVVRELRRRGEEHQGGGRKRR